MKKFIKQLITGLRIRKYNNLEITEEEMLEVIVKIADDMNVLDDIEIIEYASFLPAHLAGYSLTHLGNVLGLTYHLEGSGGCAIFVRCAHTNPALDLFTAIHELRHVWQLKEGLVPNDTNSFSLTAEEYEEAWEEKDADKYALDNLVKYSNKYLAKYL